MGRLRSGDTVAERFVVRGRLAAGGMAEIYVADAQLPQGLTRPVVIKRVHAHLVDDPEFTTMFLDEVRISSQLVHPGIIPVLDAIDARGELMLVLEYVPGWDLAAVLRTRGAPLPIEAVAHLGRSLAATLSAVHEAKDAAGKPLEIVHRDLSPSNVLVADDGTIRLLDFGVAKAASRATRTATRSLKGKLAYMSPEQLKGTGIGPATDLYALGLVLFEALTGQRALAASDDVSVLERAREPKHVAPSTLRPDVPAELDTLVLGLLASEPDERTADGAEVERALARFDPSGAGRHLLREAVVARLGSAARPLATETSAVDAALAAALADSGPRTLRTAPGADAGGPTAVTVAASAGGDAVDVASPTGGASPRRWIFAVLGVAVLAAIGVGVAMRDDGMGHEEEPVMNRPAVAEGFVRVRSEPPGARVTVAGRDRGEHTPTVVAVPGGETVTIGVDLDDHEPAEREVAAEPGQTVDVDVALVRLRGRLAVRTEPAGATVVLDGEEVGVTPWESNTLERRVHELEMRLEGHASYEERIDLGPRREITIERALAVRRATGTLDVQSTPWATVTIDGRRIAESTPVLGLRLPVGDHVVRLHNPRRDLEATRRVTVREGERARLVVELR